MKTVRNLTQAYTLAPWRKQVQIIGMILLCFLLGVLIASIYLNISARAATNGREILLMQVKIERLKLDNADLKTRLGAALSASEMKKRALEMGFEPIEKGEPIYILVPGYVERESVILAAEPRPVEPVILTLPPRFTESLIDWMKRRIMLTTELAPESIP